MEKGRVKGVSSISFVPSLSIQFFTVSLRGEREREREIERDREGERERKQRR
jgi:hypothetical protein